jgi:hypothetical protein
VSFAYFLLAKQKTSESPPGDSRPAQASKANPQPNKQWSEHKVIAQIRNKSASSPYRTGANSYLFDSIFNPMASHNASE